MYVLQNTSEATCVSLFGDCSSCKPVRFCTSCAGLIERLRLPQTSMSGVQRKNPLASASSFLQVALVYCEEPRFWPILQFLKLFPEVIFGIQKHFPWLWGHQDLNLIKWLGKVVWNDPTDGLWPQLWTKNIITMKLLSIFLSPTASFLNFRSN